MSESGAFSAAEGEACLSGQVSQCAPESPTQAPYVLRPDSTPSFFSERGVRAKRRQLRRRGFPVILHGWLFVTLTIDPSRYPGPASAHETAKKRFPDFFRLLTKHGCTWERYAWKMEPHGLDSPSCEYPHYHVLIECRRGISSVLLTQCWGLGRTAIQRVNDHSRRTFNYFTKLVRLPGWVSDQEQVRFMQTSRGFYGRGVPCGTKSASKNPSVFPFVAGRRDSRRSGARRKATIGERHRRRERTVVLSCPMSDGRTRRHRIELEGTWEATQRRIAQAMAANASRFRNHPGVAIENGEIRFPNLETLKLLVALMSRTSGVPGGGASQTGHPSPAPAGDKEPGPR